MVKLNKIYTRTGDDGTTGLVNGARLPKYDLRIEAIGTVDELNAALGQVRVGVDKMIKVKATLERIQNDLFDLGSDLATPGPDDTLGQPPLRISESQTLWLEEKIDAVNVDLAPLTSFVLPGGTPLAASLHVARTVARRAERVTIALASQESDINQEAIKYLNRLSDLLFVLARSVNGNGSKDILWKPGQNHYK